MYIPTAIHLRIYVVTYSLALCHRLLVGRIAFSLLERPRTKLSVYKAPAATITNKLSSINDGSGKQQ